MARRADPVSGPANVAAATQVCRLQRRRVAGAAWRPWKLWPPRLPPLPAYQPGSRPRRPPGERRRPGAARRLRWPSSIRLAPSRAHRDRCGNLPTAPGHERSALLARRHRPETVWQPHHRPANRSVRRPHVALQPGALPRSDGCPGRQHRTEGHDNRRWAPRCCAGARCSGTTTRERRTY